MLHFSMYHARSAHGLPASFDWLVRDAILFLSSEGILSPDDVDMPMKRNVKQQRDTGGRIAKIAGQAQ